jgi:RNA polymerase sigma-B factor
MTPQPPSDNVDDDDDLFRSFAASGDRRIRNVLVERHTGLAVHIAKRFSANYDSSDDLRQVALYGLVKAVDRFDPDHGAQFSSFAGSTIEGELKRYFRDRTWVVRVPRSAKELHLAVRKASDELTQAHGASPTVDQLAEHLRIERDDVLRGLAASAAYRMDTLDSPNDDGSGVDRQQILAVDDSEFGASDDRAMVRDLLEQLPRRERQIVELRFFEELSQAEIAERVGLSQMHVSRLLRKSFEQMRSWASPGDL